MTRLRSTELVVLLPPSEGKAEGGRGRFGVGSGTFGRRLGAPRRAVVEALAAAPMDAKVLGVRGPLLERAVAATAAIVDGRARARPAWQRYTGVVWEHLDPATMDDDRRARVVVPSALLGLVTGTDPVPDHRLKFTVGLAGVGRLDRFWRPHLTAAFRRHARGATIVDLLPNEHAAALDLAALEAERRVIRTSFRGSTGHEAKAVKGVLARHLLDGGLAAIDAFSWNGWSAAYDAEAGTISVRR